MNIDEYTTIVPKGTRLYHGTGEPFDVRKIRPGGYDEVFWTSDSKDIARSYISHPLAGTYTNPRNMLIAFTNPRHPQDREQVLTIMGQLGITDFLVSRVWAMVKDHNEKGYEIVRKAREYKAKSKDLDTMDYVTADKFLAEWDALENAEEKYDWWYEDQILAKYLVKKLKTLFGYEPDDPDRSYDVVHKNYMMWGYKLRTKYINNKEYLLPANFSHKGKLLTIVTQRDMKFFNFAKDREGDLMDVDYHNISLFQQVEKKGFDGIIINDFAQTAKWGNYGHRSWGFFRKTLKDVKVISLQGQIAPTGDLVEKSLIKNLLRRFK